MDLFEAIEKRRSIRKFTDKPLSEEIVRKALQAAVLCPNSSNVQTWDFHWVKGAEKRAELVKACLSQAAARTASHLIVVVADPALWRRANPRLIEWVKAANAPKSVLAYYEKFVPLTYRWGFLNVLAPFKWLGFFFTGLFRPVPRTPVGRRDLQEVSIKSAALASENFVLAVTAQGGATCMMEGFDEWRVKRLLKLPCSARIVMVLAAGYESDRGTWGPRYRLPMEEVVHIWE